MIKIEISGKSPVAAEKLKNIAERVIRKVGIEEAAEVGLFFVSDRKIAGLNKKFRKVAKPTDVLSFPLEEIECKLTPIFCRTNSLEKPVTLGDIFISMETAKRQAEAGCRPLKREIIELFIHGMLHLVGLDHERSLEEERVWDKIANSPDVR